MVGVITYDTALEQIGNKVEAAKVASSYVGTSDHTLRKWRKEFYREGRVKSSTRGGNYRNALTTDEEVQRKTIKYLRTQTSKHTCVITAGKVCTWVNETLIPSLSVPDNYPKSISRVTAWRWMREMGFVYKSKKNGFVDGHEREDVVKDRKDYLKRIHALESTHQPPPTCSDNIHPYNIGNIDAERQLVLIFHDESTFHVHDGRHMGWTEKGKEPLLPKGKGQGLMVSDVIDEHGFLQLTE